jgi:hypothetical protein
MFLQARSRSNVNTKDAIEGSLTVRTGKSTRTYTLRTSRTTVGYLDATSRTLIPVPSEST